MTHQAKAMAIPHSRPTLGQDEAGAVAAVIASGQVAQGAMVEGFEKAFAAFCGRRYAAAVGSGTAGLHLTLKAMGIGTDDEVVVPSFVCAALLNAIGLAGASPLIADIQPGAHNIDPTDVARRLTKRTKAIIAPHMFGLPAEMDRIEALGLPVIEDGAQALGAAFNGRRVGSLGLASVFSFYATKIITTGEGGMVVSDSRRLIATIKDMRAYDNKRSYQLRGNYKMTDMQAAMGLTQLDRLPAFIARRKQIALAYDRQLQGLALTAAQQADGRIYYRYVVTVAKGLKLLVRQTASRGVAWARPVFCPLHRLLNRKGYPITEKAWRSSLSLPIYPSLGDDEVAAVVAALRAAMRS